MLRRRAKNTVSNLWQNFQKDVDSSSFWNSTFLKCKAKRSKQTAAWIRYSNYMDDDLWRGTLLPDGTEPMQVNELKSSIFSILPHILLEEPEINIRSYSPENAQAAMVWEAVAKYIDKQYDLFDELLRAAYDALLLGNGIFKFGFWDDALLNNPTYIGGPTESHNIERVAHASYTSLFTIYPDRGAKRWKEQRYLINVLPKFIGDLWQNDVYDKKVVKSLTPTLKDSEIYGYKPDVGTTEEPEFVSIVEVHDFYLNKLRIFALGQDKDDASGWLFNDVQPYNVAVWDNLQFFPRPFTIWGDSVSQIVEKQQKSLSEVMTYMGRSMQREGIIKILYDLAKIGENDRAKLSSNEDAFIGITAAGGDLASALHVVDYKTAQKDFNFNVVMNKLQETIRIQTGVTQQEMGVHEPGVETKAEANMLKAASEVKNLLRRRMFSLFAERVVSRLLYIISVEYTPERICNMAGLNPQLYAPVVATFLPFNGRLFDVEYGNSAVNSRVERIDKLRVFTQLMAPYQQMINPAIWLRMVTQTLDFDYDVELLIYNMLGQGPESQNQLNSIPGATNAGQNVLQSRVSQGNPGFTPDIGMGAGV
ncbi:hypothetical protein LCGC14_0578290 [marine sediment metagenome]|uniref:Bacteriophage head to tail connecting protein n=1 Tax=marine sediment metagenome TaxID=412755 RepID=A0A0F9UQH4_9ZZZZ